MRKVRTMGSRAVWMCVLIVGCAPTVAVEVPEPRQVVYERRWDDVPVDLPTFGDTTRLEVWTILADAGRHDEFVCLSAIFERESGWRPEARGDSGRSHGLGQRHAPSWGVPPDPWPVDDQVAWFVDYADRTYGGPCPAWERWQQRAANRGGAGWW